ncbi:hypothetical protein [Phormidium sp. CCY1219]|uniref:hypothetical protein n=1 Tax=Phormidium sp. CCY1219 TaxID=2886104 RepID=UPI002D779E3D|nr:hypothetical protein [Phormidium sp. CCY1219]
MLKLLAVRGAYKREANCNKRPLAEEELPKLWILTPTASQGLLSGFRAILEDNGVPGVYPMGDYLRTAIVAIHQLPRTPDTLWLRILGRGRVQQQAIDELEALPEENPFRSMALKMLYNLQRNLQVTQNTDEEDRELIMRLAPLYERDRLQAIREGEQRGLREGERRGLLEGEQRGIREGEQRAQRQFVENLLRGRFGELDAELATIVDPLLALPTDELTSVMLQLSTLSREELIARFASDN